VTMIVSRTMSKRRNTLMATTPKPINHSVVLEGGVVATLVLHCDKTDHLLSTNFSLL